MGAEPRDDEYDCLIRPITRGLRSRLLPEALALSLDAFVRAHFGVDPPRDTRLFAAELVAWYAGEPD